VDLRQGSASFGQYTAVELSEENKTMLYIPRGFAHGFAVLRENTKFQYKCDNYYCPESEGSYRWNDPAFGIAWPFEEGKVILSEKDSKAPLFAGL
ncbi:MAG: dTDP-4-dehydrorhamnose 3,5-epimerase family protein, partial [Bacteroidales bacterium]|nr:dTDP-4-dehydrorhamnose 3,5-epimerase family protein [Bacteroidales bacterium]